MLTANVADYQTGPIIWVNQARNGQHAFYQLIHQGTKMYRAISSLRLSPITRSLIITRKLLLLFAQTEALAFGKSREVVEQEYRDQG